ncbi:MAG: glutamate synthase subunit alpha, partial [Oscillospiraceae bacterium]|nr:glutamate synthase subunit alpha [Oscillospiraceae bacterium]
MEYSGLPQKQGLYDPKFEHDACGIGFIGNIKGKKSHKIISQAITILKNLAHRGGVGSDPETGDGAGILIQMPHTFMKKVCKNEGIDLPEENAYGVGMLFLSPDIEKRKVSMAQLSKIIEEEQQTVLGFREVPTYAKCIGAGAREAMPRIMQVFIKKNESLKSVIDFERKLYIIGKRAESEIRCGEDADKYFYFSSLSARTIVYKGMLTPDQVNEFYLDLKDVDMKTAIALVHSRFSTNTFPSWERAHPNRYIIHNGEINTIRGNVNWIKAREKMFDTDLFGEDMKKISGIINEDGSDSAMLDNYIQALTLSGYSLPHAVMTAIPEPWENDTGMDETKRAFYKYHSCLTEPWDGPAAVAFTDGTLVGATLDRNGLRPARYYVTSDDTVILSSEVGVLDIPDEKIIRKERLHPGRMLLIDTNEGRIIDDAEIKKIEAEKHPYKEWIDNNLIELTDLDEGTDEFKWHDLVEDLKKKCESQPLIDQNRVIALESLFTNREPEKYDLPLLTRQKAFGYTWEDVITVLKAIVEKGEDAVNAMGTDAPLAVLSEKPQLLYNYFKQLFAQVTNPPIDAIREKIVISTGTLFGSEANLLNPSSENCRRILAESPILSNGDLKRLKSVNRPGFKSVTLSTLFNVNEKGDMEDAIENIFAAADVAINNGCNIIILSDKGVDESKAA